MKISMLHCQTKIDRCTVPRLRAYDAQTSAACQAPKGKKKMCFGTVCCILVEGHKLLEQTLGSACSVASALFEFILGVLMPIVCQCPGTHGRQYDKITKDLSCCMFLSHSVIVSCISFIEKQFFGSLTTMGL